MNLKGRKTFNYYGLNVEVIDETNCVARIHSAVDSTEFEFTHKLFDLGDRVLVAGGGMGSVAAWTAMKVGVANVVIYEANPKLVSSVVRNVEFEGQIPNIWWGALSTEVGETTFYIRDHWGGSSLAPGNHTEEIKVPTVDINNVVTRNAINALSLDVEGAEFDLIPHLNMNPIKKIMMEIHEDIEKAEALIKLVTDQGFQIVQWHTQWPSHPLHVVALSRTTNQEYTPIQLYEARKDLPWGKQVALKTR